MLPIDIGLHRMLKPKFGGCRFWTHFMFAGFFPMEMIQNAHLANCWILSLQSFCNYVSWLHGFQNTKYHV